jgi:ubiquinone/menaquinone biosynthesis C-methylase UbiE
VWAGNQKPGFLHGTGSFLARHGDLQRIVFNALQATGSLKGSPSVLEVGCGTAPVMSMLSKYTNRRFGIDVSLSSAAISRSNCISAAADGRALPFIDNTFHIVYSTGVLDLFTDIEASKFLVEMLRVLRPGGKAVVITASEGCFLHSAVMKHLLKRGRWRYGDKRTFRTLGNILPRNTILISEKKQGAIFQLRFVSYLFEEHRILRRLYHGFFLVVSVILGPLNRLPGAVLVTTLEKR